jgi:hypothetical protein
LFPLFLLLIEYLLDHYRCFTSNHLDPAATFMANLDVYTAGFKDTVGASQVDAGLGPRAPAHDKRGK